MGEGRAPAVFTIPPHRAFADALVAGIIAQHGNDLMSLARGLILVPNHRAVTAITAAFIRQAEQGLLLPRFVVIGDVDGNDAPGLAIDSADEDAVPPAIEPLQRQLILARLVQDSDPAIDAAQAVRLAADLARTLDQMLVEQVDPDALRTVTPEDLAHHWQASLGQLRVILDRWPQELAQCGRIDLADRRNRLLIRTAQAWRAQPPAGFVIAAGISTSAAATAALLRTVARLPKGQVVLAGLDLLMPDEEWSAIGGSETVQPIETHPQHHLCQILNRIGVARPEVRTWRWGSEVDARAARSRAISNAMAPADFTAKWESLDAKDRSLAAVQAIELATPAEEAQAIAIALRERIEQTGQTAALVTPDRALAARVSAHLGRWGIAADDSAGLRLSVTLPGTLILLMAQAVAERFAPVPLLALLKHQLVQAGEAREAWRDGARRLDIALRGPRPAEGLDGITRFLTKGDGHARPARIAVQDWWAAAAALLAPLEETPRTLGAAIAMLRDGLDRLGGDGVWEGVAGRAASDLFEALERDAALGPNGFTVRSLPALLRTLMDDIAVRDISGGHPRVSIWGLIEARLQSANLVILGGLNEGIWPALPAPDPWLAAPVRRALGLPGLERRIGMAAHDLAGALGSPDVILTRAKRDTGAPTIASRFWLRIAAMTGGLRAPDSPYAAWARQIDQPSALPAFATRPAPCPPRADRPRKISVTEVDGLKADPYSFYARRMLGLSALDPVDAEPGPSWRGSLIHRVLDRWAREHNYHPGALLPVIADAFAEEAVHPLLRALWLPRLEEAAEWIAAQVAANAAEGRVPLVSEQRGEIIIDGVTLYGRADRIDRSGDGLVIVDYKTGAPPPTTQTIAGFAAQLGLIGMIADRGGFGGVSGTSTAFEYWSLARSGGSTGYVKSPTGTSKNAISPDAFVPMIAAQFQAALDEWLNGDAPFTAKLHPEYGYGEHDQLMRLDEWRGR